MLISLKNKSFLFIAIIHSFLNVAQAETDLEIKQQINDRNKFMPLPISSVTLSSWLKKEGEFATAPSGLSAIKEILNNNVWKNPIKIKKRGAFGWWPYEQQAYFIDGVTRTALITHNKELLRDVEETYDSVAKRAEANQDGYFFCDMDDYKKDWSKHLDEGTDLVRWKRNGVEGMYWSLAVFSRGVVAMFEKTNGDKYREILKAYAHHYYNKGRDEEVKGKPITGHELYFNRGLASLGPIAEYIRLTGDKEALDNAIKIFKNNEDGMVKNYLNGEMTTTSHGVTYNELTKLYAIGYLLTGREDYLQTSINAYKFVDDNHMQPYGVHSAEEFLLGVGASIATETCDISDFIWSNLWLLRATGDGEYADKIEKAFYNAAQKMVLPDYTKHVYFQSPNQLPGIAPVKGKRAKMFEYKKVHSPICCSRNLTRVLPNFAGHSIMKTKDGLGIIFYIPATINTEVNGQPVEININTQYPFNGNSEITFNNNQIIDFSLKLRIPKWCNAPQVKINGELIKGLKIEDGFITLKQGWNSETKLDINFPMQPKLITGKEHFLLGENGKRAYFGGHGKAIQLKKFKDGAPYAYVVRGPLTFALPLEKIDDAKVAILVNNPEFNVKVNNIPNGWSWGDETPVSIEVSAQKLDVELNSNELPKNTFEVVDENSTKLKLIPYGSTGKYRMTMFPLAK
jgi:DUF1680 family protein